MRRRTSPGPARTKLAIGADFCQLSGEDATALPFLIQGGVGCISVTSNVAPKLTAQMHTAWRAGDIKKAMEINERLMPVNDAMFCETSPGPVKYALSVHGPDSGRSASAAGTDFRGFAAEGRSGLEKGRPDRPIAATRH